jgi:hypothetical protein
VDDGVVVVEEDGIELVEDDGVEVEDAGVWLVVSVDGVVLCGAVVEVAVPVVPPVVDVAEDWFMSVPVVLVGVELVVPAVPVVSVLVAGVVVELVDGLVVVLVEDWLFCSPAPLF